MSKKKKEDKAPVLTRFVAGETSFLSTGTSHIKVTKNGKAELIELPIKSLGVAEVQEAYLEMAPKPPERFKRVKKGSPEALALGLNEDKEISYLDTADPDYRAEMRKLNDAMLWDSVIKGLDIEFVDKDGNAITDDDLKKAALIDAEITGHHLDQLMKDISELTRTLELRADFLSGML